MRRVVYCDYCGIKLKVPCHVKTFDIYVNCMFQTNPVSVILNMR